MEKVYHHQVTLLLIHVKTVVKYSKIAFAMNEYLIVVSLSDNK